MGKKKVKKENLINLSDDIELDKEIEETKKSNIKEEKIEIKEKEVKEEIKKEEKSKEITNTSNKSKFNVFLLIICLLIIIYLGITFYLSKNYELTNLIKTISFLGILFITIIVLFKTNTKKTTPYILLITFILIGYVVFQISYSEKEIYVVDFINKDISEVIKFTDKYNLKLNTNTEYSDTVLKNHVIMQEYGINTLIKEIDTFNVTISLGPNYNKEVVVSNLTGFKYDDVMKYIKDNYLSNVEITFIKSDKEKDTVIEQVGSGSLKRCDLIKFVFSYGNEEIEPTIVKSLKGLSLFEATSYLKRYNIPYEIKYEYSDYDVDTIVSQDIVDNIVSDKLTLVVSKGKKIIVPDLSKMTSLEITKWALENNVKVSFKEIYNKEYESGKIIETNYSKGDVIDSEPLIITISKGSMVMPKIDDLATFKLWASENNINYEEVYEFNNDIAEGNLIKTNIKEGEKIIETDTIILTISKGKSVTIPNLVGKNKNTILKLCQDNNLTCSFTYGGLTDNVQKDISIKQSKPHGSVVSSKTNVLITLSSGIYEKVNVPSFIGKTKQEIQTTCNSLGIKCNFTYNNTYNDTLYDKCLSQDKTGTVIKGSTINITLSIGPAKTYSFVLDGSLLSIGNPEQTKKTLEKKLKEKCPGVNFNFSFVKTNTGIGLIHPSSQIKIGQNSVVQGKTYNVIIQSN